MYYLTERLIEGSNFLPGVATPRAARQFRFPPVRFRCVPAYLRRSRFLRTHLPKHPEYCMVPGRSVPEKTFLQRFSRTHSMRTTNRRLPGKRKYKGKPRCSADYRAISPFPPNRHTRNAFSCVLPIVTVQHLPKWAHGAPQPRSRTSRDLLPVRLFGGNTSSEIPPIQFVDYCNEPLENEKSFLSLQCTIELIHKNA